MPIKLEFGGIELTGDVEHQPSEPDRSEGSRTVRIGVIADLRGRGQAGRSSRVQPLAGRRMPPGRSRQPRSSPGTTRPGPLAQASRRGGRTDRPDLRRARRLPSRPHPRARPGVREPPVPPRSSRGPGDLRGRGRRARHRPPARPGRAGAARSRRTGTSRGSARPDPPAIGDAPPCPVRPRRRLGELPGEDHGPAHSPRESASSRAHRRRRRRDGPAPPRHPAPSRLPGPRVALACDPPADPPARDRHRSHPRADRRSPAPSSKPTCSRHPARHRPPPTSSWSNRAWGPRGAVPGPCWSPTSPSAPPAATSPCSGGWASSPGSPALRSSRRPVPGSSAASRSSRPPTPTTGPTPPADEGWSDLRHSGEAPYLGLALPRFLLRGPYGTESRPIETFAFEEFPGPPPHEAYLWANPAFAVAVLLGAAFDSDGHFDPRRLSPDLTDLPLCTRTHRRRRDPRQALRRGPSRHPRRRPPARRRPDAVPVDPRPRRHPPRRPHLDRRSARGPGDAMSVSSTPALRALEPAS